MSSDRAYLQSEYPRRSTTALVWLVSTIIAAFVIQLILQSPKLDATGTVARFLALTIHGLKDWHLWTLLTHGLLHDTSWPFHILFTIVGLIFVGRELEPILGARRFIGLFAGAIFLGGLVWAAVNWRYGGTQFGASAGVYAFLVVLTNIQPHQEMTIFFFPVSFRLRHIVYVLLAVDLLGLVFYELLGAPAPLGLNPSAHLGGMLAGWLYIRFLHASDGWDRAAGFALPKWLRFRTDKRPAPTPAFGQRRHSTTLRADVDRILDKINSHGFGALSDEEKRTLDEAKDLLSKH